MHVSRSFAIKTPYSSTEHKNLLQAEKSSGGQLMFEDEMRALHHGDTSDADVLEEFESYFSGLVGDVERNNEKYSAAMRQLEELLDLERETELIRRKVAAFTLDYDDDLVIIHPSSKCFILFDYPPKNY